MAGGDLGGRELGLWEAEPVPDSPLEAPCLELPLSILCPMILQ